MRPVHLLVSLLVSLTALYVGCANDGDTTTEDDDGSGPGVGGGTTGPGSGGMTSAAGGATGAGGGGQGGNNNIIGDCSQVGADHVLVNELGVGAVDAEFIEIHNPGSAAVDLTGYYVSDNSTYYRIAQNMPFAPIYNASNMGTDFLVAFPPGTMIAAGAYLTIQTGNAYFDQYASCPDFALQANVTCNGAAVPSMTVPNNGDRGTAAGTMISNSGEMVILFCWDGTSNTVKDVDYVNYDDDAVDQTHVDKSGEPGYVADTAAAAQITNRVLAPATAGAQFGIERCASGETDEAATGGNGIAGHDETSENWSLSWQESVSRTPGAVNSCQ